MRRTIPWFLLVLAISLSIAFISLEGGNAADQTAPPPARSTIQALLVCNECAEIGQPIYLWATPEGSGVVGSVPNHTPVTVLEMDMDMRTGLLYYQVSGAGSSGWVAYQYVQK